MWILAAVASRKYANFFTLRSGGSRYPFDQRRFARSTSRDVANADHRPIEFGGVKGAAPIQGETSARDCVVQEAERG
jgi:hypothetical protein